MQKNKNEYLIINHIVSFTSHELNMLNGRKNYYEIIIVLSVKCVYNIHVTSIYV